MLTERIIGIDFGTSTSVIRVKRYLNGKPVNDRLETKAVTFNMGNTMVPTLIQKVNGERCYGFDAAIRKRKEIVYSNFKLDLESEDIDVRANARSLTEDFLKYMARTYREQSEAGHLGEAQDRERTIISYPVKWSNDTKGFMIQAAKSAGFPNVEGMDEATAAIQAIAVQNSEMLRQKGYFQVGQPINLLLIDMGAGTTDLVLCRHTPGEGASEILCTYPQKGKTLFGGQELDAFLMDYIREKLPEGISDMVLRNCGVAQFKAWKEGTVSPSLIKGEAVTYCGPVDQILSIMQMDMESYHLDREEFERCAVDYLKQLPELVNGCLSEAGMNGGDVDLVILTGGHSQWYFTAEMLKGEMKSLGSLNLKKIERNPDRIIQIALPQETVALGLVYSPMNTSYAPEQEQPQKTQLQQGSGALTIDRIVEHRSKETDLSQTAKTQGRLIHIPHNEPTCIVDGNIEYWLDKDDNTLWRDAAKKEVLLRQEDTRLPCPGHDYQWIDNGNEMVRRCTRCKRIIQTKPYEHYTGGDQHNREMMKPTPISEFKYVIENNSWTITKYTGNRKKVVIPEEIEGIKVKGIGEGAFRCHYNLTEVYAPKSIEYIGRGAFFDCKRLTILDFGVRPPRPKILYLPPNLKKVCCAAFAYYPKLLSFRTECFYYYVYIGSNTIVENGAFGDDFYPMYYRNNKGVPDGNNSFE